MISAGKALVLIGAALLAGTMWLSVPWVVSGFPSVWRCFVSWLRPPYVYVLLNGIIVTIAASSRIGSSRGRPAEAPPPPPPCSYHSYGDGDFGSATSEDLSETSELIPAACEGSAGSGVGEDKGGKEEEEEEEDGAEAEEFDVSRAAWVLSSKQAKREDTESVPPEEAEKPLVSSRLSHRRPVKLSSPEGGKVLGVTKPRRQETLENTWRSITEGRPMPLTRHLKKCDSSLENRGGLTPTDPHNPKVIKKSATFRDRTNEMPMQGEGRSAFPWKEEESPALASLTRDELNKRVEAFIRKFNEEMRLQRQESLDQYRALMVSRRI
ncbi:hypothetical protein MLD38_036972 [Melastoma candidum]|uniref:Uncharacterized protein n=1 Tax=Melastoma candidum TaxID=119954 RepID=A0ACB9LKN0_9MYRT|nr:hypothetical protein MLD38_036972 [Melastoma candidum]